MRPVGDPPACSTIRTLAALTRSRMRHGTETHRLADATAAKGSPVVIGPLLTARRKIELRHVSLANPSRLGAGAIIVITTDHPVAPIHFLIHKATLAVKDGLDPAVALRAFTLHPARILGVADRLASIEAGKDAGTCLWPGNRLDAMSRVEQAFVLGREIYHYDRALHQGVFVDPAAQR